jgi:eukaryotic-like serine/threonine-protein kinase
MDKYEVTNREFKKFVERGGYKKPEFWKERFVRGSSLLGFDEAMNGFLDRTGRAGPTTWELGIAALGYSEVSGDGCC